MGLGQGLGTRRDGVTTSLPDGSANILQPYEKLWCVGLADLGFTFESLGDLLLNQLVDEPKLLQNVNAFLKRHPAIA